MHPGADVVTFQLKYCERCGGLWLRPATAGTPYCPACAHFMAELPSRRPPQGASRKSVCSAGTLASVASEYSA